MLWVYVFQCLGQVRARLGNQSGQAMVEYSTITFFILLGSAATGMSIDLPGTNPPAPFIIAFMNALTTYLGSVYYWIDMPMP